MKCILTDYGELEHGRSNKKTRKKGLKMRGKDRLWSYKESKSVGLWGKGIRPKSDMDNIYTKSMIARLSRTRREHNGYKKFDFPVDVEFSALVRFCCVLIHGMSRQVAKRALGAYA